MSKKSILLPRGSLELAWEAEFDRRFAPKKRGAKPVKVSQWLGLSSWLDDDLCWHEGRVHFRQAGAFRVVDSNAWKQTGRALQVLAKKGGEPKTLARRQKTASWVEPLLETEAPDLASLCAQSRRFNPAAMRRLKPLLAIEALSCTPLEASPARALVKAWPLSRSVLQELANENHWPASVGALAAFCLGAVGEIDLAPKTLRGIAATAQALDWLGEERFDAALLAGCALNSEAALWRYISLVREEALFPFQNATFRASYQTGGVCQALEHAETLAQTPDFWPQFPQVNWGAEQYSSRQLNRRLREVQSAVVLWRETRRDALGELHPIFCDLAIREAQAPAAAARWLKTLLELPVQMTAFLTRRHRKQRISIAPDEIPMFAAENVKGWWPHAIGLLRDASECENPTATFDLLNEIVEAFWQAERARLTEVNTSARGIGAWSCVHNSLTNELVSVMNLLRRFGPEFTRLVWKNEACHTLDQDWSSVEWAQAGLYLSQLTGRKSAHLLRLFHRWTPAFETPTAARQWCEEFERFAPHWSASGRYQLLMPILQHPYKSRGTARTSLWLITTLLKPLVEAVANWEEEKEGPISEFSGVLASLVEEVAEGRLTEAQLRAYYPALLDFLVARHRNECMPGMLSSLACLASLVCETPEQFQHLLPRLWPLLNRGWEEWDNAWRGIKAVHRHPDLTKALRLAFESAPERVLIALERLGLLAHAKALDGLDVSVLQVESAPLDEQTAWTGVLELDASLDEPIKEWRCWAQVACLTDAPPKNALKILEWPQGWRSEVEALRQKIDALSGSQTEIRERLEKRLQNLEARLDDAQGTRATMSSEIRDALSNGMRVAALQALENLVAKTLGARLQALCGASAQEVEIDADVLNALLLVCDVEENRKWARQILRHHCAGNAMWREELPANARYLIRLRERGIDVSTWLSRFERQRGDWTFWVENEPLQILQMGNRFNTCLSRDGSNAHSSIANAIDLNKRVVYARDTSGHIIGRQLWGLSTEDKLVGFCVYSTLPNPTRAPLQRAFTAYAKEFAAGCGVPLCDEGEVETLAVQSWYDDGLAEWEPQQEEVCQTNSSP